MTEAREVARVAVLWAWSFRRGEPASGFNSGVTSKRRPTRTEHGGNPLTACDIAARLEAPMSSTPDPTVPLFVELCAGTAALSLALHGGRHARPPVSRMGSKAGYAGVILATLGLRPGQGAGRYLWCEPDDGCRLMLIAYTDAALRREAAAVIRGWADEDPRALWTRLRDEGPVRGCPATWAGGEVDPREVARWGLLGWQSYRQGAPESGFRATAGGAWPDDPPDGATVADRLEPLPSLPATITNDARDVEPAQLPPGTIAFLDPPYVGTTGYAADLPRADVVALARRWAAAGAWVVISEAVPIADLVADGWYAVEITAGRVGQKRTFSRQQREWLTMSRAPVWRPSEQVGLFANP